LKIKVKITRQENANYFNANVNDIVEVEFEEYVAAVTASEIGNGALEACKAQAVACRTFAVNRGVLSGRAISDASSTA
jgi:SpoIID/LytB domain protein